MSDRISERGEANKARRLIAKELPAQFTPKEIAVELGAARETVQNWLGRYK